MKLFSAVTIVKFLTSGRKQCQDVPLDTCNTCPLKGSAPSCLAEITPSKAPHALPTYPSLPSSNDSIPKLPNPHSPMSSLNSQLPLRQPDCTEQLRELLEKYDPKSSNVPDIWPMVHHRDMIHTMYLDSILYATARLHRHTWILAASNGIYRDLRGQERWDMIRTDLERYTKSIRDYEFWTSCFIQKQELSHSALPPTYQFYGRTLAVLELASHPSTTAMFSISERALLKEMEQSFVSENQVWSQANAIARRERFGKIAKMERRKGLTSRILMASFGGSTLIIPMIIMTLDSRLVTTLLTTSICTLGIGLILAFWMDNADNKDIIAATAGYAAVLVVFVGTGNGIDQPR